jgi:UDP-N-acetylmuramate dehydrogenase
MLVYHNANLKSYHTFGIDQQCRTLIEVGSVEDLCAIYRSDEWHCQPKLILGKGSNVLFTEYYQGVVLINNLKGLTISEDESSYRLHVCGGEDWPELVENLVAKNIPGLENLAMIPGCAGSAPIQNIGAYGVEFKDICDYVDYLCLDTLMVKRLQVDECCFGYRDSIFKQHLCGKSIVVAIGIKLDKQWQPRLDYGPLADLPATATLKEIYHQICAVRRDKLPDPNVIGNAGSFFKNPVVTAEYFGILKLNHPNIVAYQTTDGMKLAAGWLIDQCGLKGVMVGGAQVHPNQALVLINKNDASSQDVIELAHRVCTQVFERYGVMLEHEVRFFNSYQEVYLQQLAGAKK